MTYMLVQFTKGLDCLAYQQLDDNGITTAFLDMDGNVIDIPPVVEYYVADPVPKVWGAPPPDVIEPNPNPDFVGGDITPP